MNSFYEPKAQVEISQSVADEILWDKRRFAIVKDDYDIKPNDIIKFSVGKEEGFVMHPISDNSYKVAVIESDNAAIQSGYMAIGFILLPDDNWEKVDESTKIISKQVAKLRELVAKNVR